jgi:hypothetical protein
MAVLCTFIAALLFPLLVGARECGRYGPGPLVRFVLSAKDRISQSNTVAHASEPDSCN